MRRSSRIRRWFKWGGLVLSLLVAITWVMSIQWEYSYRWPTEKAAWSQTLSDGGLILSYHTDRDITICGSAAIRARGPLPSMTDFNYQGWKWECNQGFILRPDHYTLGHDQYWLLPLWIPFALVIIPTGVLWWRDRRHPPGHCQKCGYNLTGNTSGVCPECGEAISPTSP